MTLRRAALAICLLIYGVGCGTPTTPGPTLLTLSVSVNSSAMHGAMQLQMMATAIFSDGSRQDVTNIAVWQSSNPNAGTVSSTGLLSIVASGTTTVSATYQNKVGSDTLELLPPCSGLPGDC